MSIDAAQAAQLEKYLSSLPTSVVGSSSNIIDLKSFIDIKKCEILNGNSKNTIAEILTNSPPSPSSSSTSSLSPSSSSSYLTNDPDVDEQLILKIPFREPVKIKFIKMYSSSPSDSKDGETNVSGPKEVKLFVDQLNISFDDSDSLPPTDSLTLSPSNLNGEELKIKISKYQNIHSITIFIKSNQKGTQITRIDHIAFGGTTVEGMNVKEIKKVED